MNVSDLIAELLPIAESLFSLIDKIKTDAPDAWASVSQEYVQATQAWSNSKLVAPPAPSPESLAGSIEPQDPTPSVPTPVAGAHTLTTAQQVAAGLPPANYTPS